MKTLTQLELPDDVFEQVEKLARIRGTDAASVAADFVTKAFRGADADEARLLADIAADREAMARRGVWLTPEEIQAAKVEGRP